MAYYTNLYILLLSIDFWAWNWCGVRLDWSVWTRFFFSATQGGNMWIWLEAYRDIKSFLSSSQITDRAVVLLTIKNPVQKRRRRGGRPKPPFSKNIKVLHSQCLEAIKHALYSLLLCFQNSQPSAPVARITSLSSGQL